MYVMYVTNLTHYYEKKLIEIFTLFIGVFIYTIYIDGGTI